jgi:hypothetical protein
LSYTQEQLDAIKAALAEGVKVVRWKDKWLEYRSFDEMKKIINEMEKALRKKAKTVRCYGKFDKGTC